MTPPETLPEPLRKTAAPPLPLTRGLLFPALLLALATLIPVLVITAPEELLRIGAPVSFSRFITPGAAQ